MKLIDRLLKIVELKHKGVKSQFYKATGLSNGALDNITYTASSKTIGKIISTYPDINPKWITDGEGPMFTNHNNRLTMPIKTTTGNLFVGETLYVASLEQHIVIEHAVHGKTEPITLNRDSAVELCHQILDLHNKEK